MQAEHDAGPVALARAGHGRADEGGAEMKQQAEHHSGVWWRPTAPDRRWYGTLSVDRSGGGRLALLSRPFPTEEPHTPLPDCRDETLIGLARSRPVTLLGCTLRGAADGSTDRSDPHMSEIAAREVLLGLDAGTPETVRVHSGSAAIPELTTWMAGQPPGPHGWGRDIAQVTVHDADDAAESIVERMPRGSASGTGERHDGRTSRRRRAEVVTEPVVAVAADGRPVPQVRATVTAVDGLALAEARHLLRSVQELAAFVTQSPPMPLWVLADPMPEEHPHLTGPIEWCWRQSTPCDGGSALAAWPAPPKDARTPLAEVLPAWHRLRRRHRTALDLMLDDLHAPHHSPRMHLLTLVAAAEALFASTVEEFPRRRKDTTLRMKLRHLADRVIAPDDAASSVVADWAEQTARARNAFTHGDWSHSAAQVAVLARATTEVLVLNVLEELGVPSSGPRPALADVWTAQGAGRV